MRSRLTSTSNSSRLRALCRSCDTSPLKVASRELQGTRSDGQPRRARRPQQRSQQQLQGELPPQESCRSLSVLRLPVRCRVVRNVEQPYRRAFQRTASRRLAQRTCGAAHSTFCQVVCLSKQKTSSASSPSLSLKILACLCRASLGVRLHLHRAHHRPPLARASLRAVSLHLASDVTSGKRSQFPFRLFQRATSARAQCGARRRIPIASSRCRQR